MHLSHHKLEAVELSYKYPDGHEAVQGISFEAVHREAVGIIGANGAGKSTLLTLMMGLLHPNGGCVRYGGIELTAKPCQISTNGSAWCSRILTISFSWPLWAKMRHLGRTMRA